MPTTFLTTKERESYDAVPGDISYREIVQHFTLTPDDLAEIKKGRGKALRFGFALRLCQLRWLGHFPNDVTGAPTAALEYLSEQLDISPQVLAQYPTQGTTRWDHMARIRQHFGYREFKHHREKVTAWLLPLAHEHDFARGLLDTLIEHLRRERIVRPGISTLERLVTQVRDQVKEQIQGTIEAQLSEAQRQDLDALLHVSPGRSVSWLQWLKTPPPQAAAKHLVEWLEKIEVCRALGANQLDLSGLHPNRLKLLAQRTRRRSSATIAGASAPERYTLLACFLHETLCDLTDQAIEMHAQLVGNVFLRAGSRRDKEFAALIIVSAT